VTWDNFAENLLTFSCQKISPGANPAIVSYTASVVKICNATSSLARFENKNILLNFAKTL
jgi:hypothetical protein